MPAQRIGVTLTEAFQIVPEQSTAAIVMHHPEASYFNAAATRELAVGMTASRQAAAPCGRTVCSHDHPHAAGDRSRGRGGRCIIAALVRALPSHREGLPKPLEVGIGFITNFFDTLGIGSFAPTTSLFKAGGFVPDERIPGTLNVGHTLPTIVEAAIYITIIRVAPVTLISLILAAVAGAWLGAGFVARLPRRYVQIGMGSVLLIAAIVFLTNILSGAEGGLLRGHRAWSRGCQVSGLPSRPTLVSARS